MAEEEAMALKIITTIYNIIENDQQLDEFAIIPTEGNTTNKSPVLYEQHNIGLESWCVKPIYNYACSVLFKHRQSLSKRQLTNDKMEELNRLLIGALLINPDMGTFWNMRRDLLQLGMLILPKEIYFSKLVLTYKSKSNEAFSYRRWLIKICLEGLTEDDLSEYVRILYLELLVTHMASHKAPNNYHSWNHRIWCLENIASKSPNIRNLIERELDYSEIWIETHISEHASFHYRQYIFKFLKRYKNVRFLVDTFYTAVVKYLNIDEEQSNFLIYLLGVPHKSGIPEETFLYTRYISLLLYDLLIFLDKLNMIFPGHESLFYHRRFVLYHLLEIAHQYLGDDFQVRNNLASKTNVSKKNVIDSYVVPSTSLNGDDEFNQLKLVKMPFSKIEGSNLSKIILNSEKRFFHDNLNIRHGFPHAGLTKRYEIWLRVVLGFE